MASLAFPTVVVRSFIALAPIGQQGVTSRHYNAHRDLAETLGFFGECWTNREARFLLQQPPETMLQLIQAAQAIYGIGYSLGRTEHSQRHSQTDLTRVQEPPKEPPAHER